MFLYKSNDKGLYLLTEALKLITDAEGRIVHVLLQVIKPDSSVVAGKVFKGNIADMSSLQFGKISKRRKWRRRKIIVYWALDAQWYSGIITSSSGLKAELFDITYDDGTQEVNQSVNDMAFVWKTQSQVPPKMIRRLGLPEEVQDGGKMEKMEKITPKPVKRRKLSQGSDDPNVDAVILASGNNLDVVRSVYIRVNGRTPRGPYANSMKWLVLHMLKAGG